LHSGEPPGTLPTAWNAGFVDIEWATEDFTQGDVKEPQRTLVFDVEEVPAPSLIPAFPPSLGVFFSQR
jgi:hypothetical protein